MPWMNLFGWGVTGLVLFIILDRLAPQPRTSFAFALVVYAINFSLPLGFCVLNQYWLAVAAGMASLLVGLYACRVPSAAGGQVGLSVKNAGLQKL